MANVAEASLAVRPPNRFPVLLGTMIVQLGLGSLYTWSLFNAPLGKLHGWQIEQVALSFSISALALGLGTLLSGNLQNRFGERKVAAVCGLILGAGLMMAAQIDSLIALYLSAGLIVGLADGIGYMMTLTNCIKWFPEKKGLISGISIGCYGLGSLAFKYINAYFLDTFGVERAFVYWGACAMVLIVTGSIFLKDAPDLMKGMRTVGEGNNEYTRGELFHIPQAYMLFTAFTAACLGGLYVISIAKDVGTQMAGLSAAEAGGAIAIIALCNTAGRFVVGFVSDYMERTKVVAVAFLIMIASVSIILFKSLDYAWLLVSIGGLAFAFGGNLSIFPAIVGEYFGLRNSSKNYGVIYQGFGIGGVLGGAIANVTHSLLPTFYLILGLSVIAFFIMLFIQPPHR